MIDADEEALRAALAQLDPDQLAALAKDLVSKLPALENLQSDWPRVIARHQVKECLDLSRVDNAAEQIKRLPGKDEAVHFLLGGRFSAADRIPAIQSLAGAKIDERYIAILGFSKANVE